MRVGVTGIIVQEFEFDSGIVRPGDTVELVSIDSDDFGNLYVFEALTGSAEGESFELDEFTVADVVDFTNEDNEESTNDQVRAAIIAELSTLGDEYGMELNDVIKFIKEHF